MMPHDDAERVLGQIERGEVIAGAAGARAIAARHEAAYGYVFAIPAAEVLLARLAWAEQNARRTPACGEAEAA